MNVWSETFRVRSYETDPGGDASIQTLCNYLQEAAGNHAGKLGVAVDQLTRRNLTWVLARLRLEVDRYPSWREEVVVETWPSGQDGLYATREFLIYDASSQTIGRGSSAWLMIDFERRRPIRIPQFITEIPLPDRPRPIRNMPSRLPDVCDGAEEKHLDVRYSDLDVNGHVNNVHYVEWSVEALSADLLASHAVSTLDVHFQAEATFGDAVTVLVDEPEPLTYLHLVRAADRELARARTMWRQKR